MLDKKVEMNLLLILLFFKSELLEESVLNSLYFFFPKCELISFIFKRTNEPLEYFGDNSIFFPPF